MTSLASALETARTLLFVPGSRPDRFEKAAASRADLVVLDLEDAVAAAGKAEAREHVRRRLADHPGAVRINAAGTQWFVDDLDAVAAHPCVVMVPKAESAETLEHVAGRLVSGSAVLGLVETAAGAVRASELAQARGVARLAFGSFDLAAELGVSPDNREAMAWTRGALVVASAASGIAAPLDGVTGDVGDEAALRDDVEHALRLGFSGKLCIHPRQVAVVHDVLTPSQDELAWARAVVAAAIAAKGDVAVLDGKMVDRPVVERARRLLGPIAPPGARGHPSISRHGALDV